MSTYLYRGQRNIQVMKDNLTKKSPTNHGHYVKTHWHIVAKVIDMIITDLNNNRFSVDVMTSQKEVIFSNIKI